MTKRPRPLLSPLTATAEEAHRLTQAVEAARAAGVFDEDFYLSSYLAADPVLKLVDPISHYLVVGYARGFRPSADFDPAAHLARNPRLDKEGMNPLLHLALAGSKPSPPDTERRGVKEVPPRPRAKPRIPDFSKLRRPWSAANRPALDVIVPVHSGFTETLEAIHCVLASRNKTPFELVVIDDKSPDARLVQHLKHLARKGLITLLRNRSNLGFAGTVNRGLRLHSKRDVILLNSDTKVYGDWVDRLLAHAGDGVATVTPFSNNASLCSYPKIFEANPMPSRTAARVLDRLCAKLNAGKSVESPTGIGFCMYVSRAAARTIGGFDEKTFGKGYGEDNDFSFRALKRGFLNLHALDVFIAHTGGVSFGAQSPGEPSRPLARLLKKHPGFAKALRRFSLDDPALAARQLLDLALAINGKSNISLHLLGASAQSKPRVATKRQNVLKLALRPEPGNMGFRVERLDGAAALPNLRGLSAERLAQLFGSALERRRGTSITLSGGGADAAELRSAFRIYVRKARRQGNPAS